MRDIAIDALGYTAALLVLLSFSMRTPAALRRAAIASNLAFIGYGFLADLAPVLCLHALLLPINGWRLRQIVQACRSGEASTPPLPPGARDEDRPIEQHTGAHRRAVALLSALR